MLVLSKYGKAVEIMLRDVSFRTKAVIGPVTPTPSLKTRLSILA